MDKESLFKELTFLVSSGMRKGDIEKAAGLSENSLSSILAGKRTIGKKRLEALEKYVADSKKKRVVLVEDENGLFVCDGRKVRLVWEDEIVQTVKAHNNEIYQQIDMIKLEKIPKERDTTIGRVIWKKEQDNRIIELKKQLK